jgi:hypothetical protein
MKQTLLFLTIYVLLFSCSKNTSDKQPFLQCDTPQYLDSTAISNKIAGSWTLTKQRWGSTGEVVTADKNIKVTFNSNGTYTIVDDSSVLAQGNWTLKIVLDSLWGLDLTVPSDYLTGYISFCNNQLLFSYSYLDGSDNLFEKVD